uniref:Leucine rich repeat containing 27 n=1 Tax=Esox lucius TaxID=8010 RepID=A0A3P9AD90_ESOLU
MPGYNSLLTTKEDNCTTSMSSLLEEDITDLHLSLDCGDNAVKTQILHIPVCVGPMPINEYVASDTLCLSRRNLKDIADHILKSASLKNLYLEGNEISMLPDTLFTSLPNLVWLDLRNNQITSLPVEIGLHRCLKTLLLEGNPIMELPLELGNVISLKALSLRHCPIKFPPQEVMQQGLQCILQYLRGAMAKRPVSVRSSLLVADMPQVQKLELTDLVKSSMDACEEMVDEDELRKFRELRQKMIQMDKAELGFTVSLSCLPRTSESVRDHKTHTLPTIKRGNVFPELPSLDMQYWKRSEERTLAAMRELREKQAILEERRKGQELLKEWRTHAKVMQAKKILELKQERLERQIEIKAPYATDGSVSEHGVVKTLNSPPMTIQKQRSTMSYKEHQEVREARDRDFELRIRSHVQMMQERHRRPGGNAQEETDAARREIEEAKGLQSELAQIKRDQDIEYRFLAFTGENSPRCYDK